jgi:septal ring factor EnvC (AmiA/AmiB activator)
MSTAPLSAFIPKQPQGHYLGSLKPKLKLKETKADLKHYSERLEAALAAVKRKREEVQRDCDRVNKEYLKEVKRGEKRRELLAVVKTQINSLMGRMCERCRVCQELQTI